LGIGTSSPSQKLDVAGNAKVSNTTGNKRLFLGQDTPSSNDSGSVELNASNSQTNWAIRTNWNVAGALEFCPSSSSGGTSYTTPLMLLNSSGNLGIGTTTPAKLLDVSYSTTSTTATTAASIQLVNPQNAVGYYSGVINFCRINSSSPMAYIGSIQTDTVGNSANALVFGTKNGTSTVDERVRIDADGSILSGSASAIKQGKIGVLFSGASNQGLVLKTTATVDGTTFIEFLNSSGSTQGYITAPTTSSVSYVTSSDQRFKENIVDAPSILETINQLQVRQFTWKENGDTEVGFIAQELHTKLPKAVAVGVDNEDGSIQRPWGVDKSAIVPYLVKSIQELSALVTAQSATITSLTERISALENR
jgi:hypothetical protein